MEFKTGNVETEKHVPFIEKIDNGYRVSVGKNDIHPMTEEHFISYIELFVDGTSYKMDLTIDQKPDVEFSCSHGNDVYAIEHCNLHGTWKNKI